MGWGGGVGGGGLPWFPITSQYILKKLALVSNYLSIHSKKALG